MKKAEGVTRPKDTQLFPFKPPGFSPRSADSQTSAIPSSNAPRAKAPRLKNTSTPSPRIHSAFCIHHSAFRSAYTLVELFLTIAVLMVVLGLMVNLANRVQSESKDHLTRLMLRQLASRMDDYLADHNDVVPEITPLITTGPADETNLQKLARQNNLEFLACLNLPQSLSHKDKSTDDLLRSLHTVAPGQTVLEDAWGSPIVFMPRQHPAIGMAPRDRPFFFSAGPDRLFLTQEDNLYSYDEAARERNAE
jgi:type II secretory pathway pseudopilin PulG